MQMLPTATYTCCCLLTETALSTTAAASRVLATTAPCCCQQSLLPSTSLLYLRLLLACCFLRPAAAAAVLRLLLAFLRWCQLSFSLMLARVLYTAPIRAASPEGALARALGARLDSAGGAAPVLAFCMYLVASKASAGLNWRLVL